MQQISKENFVDEEIHKSTKKIGNLSSYGMHQSYSVSFPEEKVCNVTFNIEPFHIHEKAKEAEETFHEVLKSIMVQRQLPQYLYKILLKQKENTALILQQYDLIISDESKSLVEYDKEYRQKSEKHSAHYELLKENIEGLISEINRIGKEEVQNIRISVIENTKNKTEKYWEKCQKLLDESAADIPFDDYIWKPPTTMLPFDELVNSFLLPQEEVFSKRRNMLSEICESRKYLENEKLDHALKLEKLEKELFEIKDNYKRKKIQFAELKRKQYRLNSRKEALSRELKDLTKSIEKEYEVEKKLVEKYHERRKRKCYMQNEENLKYGCILKDTYIEAYNLLTDVINAMIFIMENILDIPKSRISLEGSELIKINILPYLCKKGFWLDFVNAAPKDSLIDDVVLAVEDYWSCLKVYLDELNKRISICLENQELHTCLKLYYSAEKSNSSL